MTFKEKEMLLERYKNLYEKKVVIENNMMNLKGISYDNERVQGSGKKISMEELIQDKDEVIYEMEIVENAIRKLKKHYYLEYNILWKYYVELKTWNMLSFELCYSIRHLQRRRDQAINKLDLS